MIKHGQPPYLECSSRGDRRFSAFFARIMTRDFQTIEELYQSAKRFDPAEAGVDVDGRMIRWQDAKGRPAINQSELIIFYEQLWREYLQENPFLFEILARTSGLSDVYGQVGHNCQATVLWKLRGEYLTQH